MDIRRPPLRSTFLNTLINYCPRQALMDVIGDPYPRPHYMLGGSVISLLMDMFHRGMLQSDDARYAAANAYLAVVRSEPGGYTVTQEQQSLIIERTAEVFEDTRSWFHKWDGEVLASEIEIRSTSAAGTDIAAKPDMIAKLPDGSIAILDGKAMGVYTKSIAPPVYSDAELMQTLQISLYALILERGGRMYTDLPKEARDMSNKELRKNFESVPLRMNVNKIGLFQYGMVTRRKRDSENGRAGERRGNPLQVIDYTPARAEYAAEAINYAEHCIAFGLFPRAVRREQGKSSCSGCAFRNGCWSEHVAQTGNIPDFLIEE